MDLLFNLMCHSSFLGRVTAVKKAILPKLLFFFRALPNYVSKTYTESIQKDVNKFIWHLKKNMIPQIPTVQTPTPWGTRPPRPVALLFGSQISANGPMVCPFYRYSLTNILPFPLSGLLWSRSVKASHIVSLNTIVFTNFYIYGPFTAENLS